MNTYFALYDDEQCLEPVAIIAEQHLKDSCQLVWIMKTKQFAVAISNYDYQLN